MTKFNFYFNLFVKNIVNLNIIDILIFSVFININYFEFLTRVIQILIAITIVRKTLIEHSYTSFIETAFFVAGARIKEFVLINFFFNQLIFFGVSMILMLFNLVSLKIITENLFILNLVICISFLIKFVIFSLDKIKYFYKSVIKGVLFYTLFGFLSIGISFPRLGSLIALFVFFFIIHYYNRTLNYEDIY